MRRPYVGEGADGARRSATIDRTEADQYDHDDPRRQERLDSAAAWEAQAEALRETEAVPSLTRLPDGTVNAEWPDGATEVRVTRDLFDALTTAHNETVQRDNRVDRDVILDIMSGYSEEQFCASWLNGLDEILHTRGGPWETLGRTHGWPLGYRGEDGWVTWEEAAAVFAKDKAHRGTL